LCQLLVLLTGFGFLTFELEESVDLVVNEHFIKIAGKQVISDFLQSLHWCDSLGSCFSWEKLEKNSLSPITLQILLSNECIVCYVSCGCTEVLMMAYTVLAFVCFVQFFSLFQAIFQMINQFFPLYFS